MGRYPNLGSQGKPGEEVVIKIGESLYDTLDSIIMSFPIVEGWKLCKSEFLKESVFVSSLISFKEINSPDDTENAKAVKRGRQKFFVELNERVREVFPLSETIIGVTENQPMDLVFVFKNPVIDGKKGLESLWETDNSKLKALLSGAASMNMGALRDTVIDELTESIKPAKRERYGNVPSDAGDELS